MEELPQLRLKTLLFCGALALAIALSVLLRGRRASHWLFAAFATAIALWYGSQSAAELFGSPTWVVVRDVFTVLLPQFAVHLFQNIVPLDVPTYRTPLSKVATALGVPMLALALSPFRGEQVVLGLLYAYVFGLLAAALFFLARRGKQSRSRAIRDRVRFLVAIGGLATTFTLADFLWLLDVRIPPIGAALSIVFLFVLAESLTRPRLADIYEMAGRVLVTTALAFSLAGIFYFFVEVIGTRAFSTMYLNAVLAAIVFLLLFEPLQTEVETRIHQFFFRERFGFESSVADVRRKLGHVFEVDEMVEAVLAGLEKTRRFTLGAIYLLDQDGDGFDLRGSIGAGAPKRIEALSARPLLDRLAVQASLPLEELAREGLKSDQAILTAAAALGTMRSWVLLAIRGEDESVVGLLCVADDRVKDAFTPEEISLLEGVAAQMGIAVANSRVYSRMKERDRLAALGSLAAGLAHEVKNPLGSIKGAAQLLEETVHEGAAKASTDTSQEFIGIIIEEVNRLDRVVGSFLDYARPHAGNPIPLDINAAVRRTVQILSSQLSTDTGVDVKLELSEVVPRAKIDPEKFRQVVLNLMQNGIQAMDGRGKITVTTGSRGSMRAPPSSGREPSRSDAPASDRGDAEYAEVSVRDTGPGISQKVLKNLFIPFFTTKTQGTGLGLAISQSIVQNAGGSIDVQTKPGAGTTFTIILPAATDALYTPLPTAAAPRTEKEAGGETSSGKLVGAKTEA